MDQTQRRPGDDSGAGAKVDETAASIPRPADTARRRRIRRQASRQLDALLGIQRPESRHGLGDFWHVTHMDLDVPERDRAGRELLGAAA